MLSIAEEVLLLSVDDETGVFLHGPEVHVELALGGAVLMDLALVNRIDTDPERLFLVDASPTGDDLLDEVLARVAASETERRTEDWLIDLREEAATLRGRLIERLVDRGILERVEDRVLGLFTNRRYPVVDDRADREVRRRIVNALFSDEIPEPRDVMIVDLVVACDLLETLIHPRDVKTVWPRVEQLERMELIGREVSRKIGELRTGTPA